MKHLARIGFVSALLLLGGCSFIDGVRVELRADSFEALKAEVVPFLQSKGFTSEAPINRFNTSFSRRSGSADVSQRSLFANFYSDGETYFFFVGKGNTHEFSDDEVRVMDECAAFLAECAELIVAGSASKRGTSLNAREKFYAKIKKA